MALWCPRLALQRALGGSSKFAAAVPGDSEGLRKCAGGLVAETGSGRGEGPCGPLGLFRRCPVGRRVCPLQE